MIWNFNALNRAAAAVLLGAVLLLAGTSVASAQGRGKRVGKVAPHGERLEKPKPVEHEPGVDVPKPHTRPVHGLNHERHQAHKLCVKNCKRVHKAAIRACHDRTGADRAACERSANGAHRRCVRGCGR